MSLKRITAALLFAASIGGLAVAHAGAPVVVDPEKSRVTATVRQMGVSMESVFATVSGTLQFDPAAPQEGSARVVIDARSSDIGMRDFNKEVAKAEWLDSRQYPEAVFAADGLTPLSDDRYAVTGTPSPKGKTVELTVAAADGGLTFSGEWPLKRQDFDIGGSGWDGVVEDIVKVRFRIHQPGASL